VAYLSVKWIKEVSLKEDYGKCLTTYLFIFDHERSSGFISIKL